jgi:hypothetical protein
MPDGRVQGLPPVVPARAAKPAIELDAGGRHRRRAHGHGAGDDGAALDRLARRVLDRGGAGGDDVGGDFLPAARRRAPLRPGLHDWRRARRLWRHLRQRLFLAHGGARPGQHRHLHRLANAVGRPVDDDGARQVAGRNRQHPVRLQPGAAARLPCAGGDGAAAGGARLEYAPPDRHRHRRHACRTGGHHAVVLAAGLAVVADARPVRTGEHAGAVERRAGLPGQRGGPRQLRLQPAAVRRRLRHPVGLRRAGRPVQGARHGSRRRFPRHAGRRAGAAAGRLPPFPPEPGPTRQSLPRTSAAPPSTGST